MLLTLPIVHVALAPLSGRARPPVMRCTDHPACAGITAPRVALKPESEEDERGAVASEAFAAMDIIATVPQELVLATHAGEGWAARLTEEALASRADDRRAATRRRLASWRYTGWSTASEDRISRARAATAVGNGHGRGRAQRACPSEQRAACRLACPERWV